VGKSTPYGSPRQTELEKPASFTPRVCPNKKGFGDRDLDMHGHSTRARQSVRRIVEISPTLFNIQ
jgi:hypothetical protein